MKGSLVSTEALTRSARPSPSSLAFFSLTSTAAAAPSTFTEPMSLVFG